MKKKIATNSYYKNQSKIDCEKINLYLGLNVIIIQEQKGGINKNLYQLSNENELDISLTVIFC